VCESSFEPIWPSKPTQRINYWRPHHPSHQGDEQKHEKRRHEETDNDELKRPQLGKIGFMALAGPDAEEGGSHCPDRSQEARFGGGSMRRASTRMPIAKTKGIQPF